MATTVSISLDWLLIVRCLVALSWGFGYATFLQYHRLGQFWADERTWLTVVIGVGVDFAIGFNTEWLAQLMIVVLSAIPIIMRSLINESKRPPIPSGYKVLWGLEDSIAIINQITEKLEALIEGKEGETIAEVSRILRLAHGVAEMLKATRRGEYESRKIGGKV